MKKMYIKPAIKVERFMLTQSIAAGCSARKDESFGIPTMTGKTVCGWQIPGTDMIAWMQTPACNDLYGPNEEIMGICYNNPEGGVTIFGSV